MRYSPEKAKAAVIVPVYEVEQYIDRCIQSIVNQTCKNYMSLTIDDGTPDGGACASDEAALADERFISIHQKHGGLSSARNAGLELCALYRGLNWVSFVDSDDWLHADFLNRLLRAAEENDADISMAAFAFPDRFVDDPEFGESDVRCYNNGSYMSHYKERLEAFACGRCYDVSLFDRLRFPAGRYFEDLFVIPKVLFSSKKAVLVDLPLYYYFQGNNNAISKNYSERKARDYADSIRENLEYFRTRSEPIYRLFCKRTVNDAVLAYNTAKHGKERIELWKKCIRLLYANRHSISLNDYSYTYAICSVLRIRVFHSLLVRLRIIRLEE